MAKPNIQELGAKRPLQISFSLIIESVYQYSLLAERPSLLGTFVISSPLPPTAQTNMDMFCFFSAYYSVLLDNYTSGLNTEGDEASSRLYSREEGPAPPPLQGTGTASFKNPIPRKMFNVFDNSCSKFLYTPLPKRCLCFWINSWLKIVAVNLINIIQASKLEKAKSYLYMKGSGNQQTITA